MSDDARGRTSTPGTARARRLLLPLLASVLIVAWQGSFAAAPTQPREPWAMRASMGLSVDIFRFFYFFDHFGVFPVGAAEVPSLGPTRADAERFVAEHGDRLRMDFGEPVNTPRFGDYGKLFLFYPGLWLHHDPAHPSAMPANATLWVLALLALFWAMWREGQARLGALLVVLLGSDPFQIVETWGRGNVFSLPISVAVLALAAAVPLLARRGPARWSAWLVAIGGGVALATAREARSEAAVIAVALAGALLLARAPWARRLALLAAFVGAFALTGATWSRYWARTFDRAATFVAHAGGDVFRPRVGTHHAFWHAVACGLGDYGGDRGFTWDDQAMFRWATTADPATNPTPIPYHWTHGYYFDETSDGRHTIAPTDVPAYNDRIRARVLDAIRSDPAWYARVLLQRALAIQRDATPASLSLGVATLALPGAGWLVLPVLLWALARRRWFHAALVAFALPTSAVALIVYSGRGTTYYGIAHLVALAVLVDLLAEALARRRAEPRTA